MTLQLTRSGTQAPDEAELVRLQREYADRACVVVPRLLAPDLLRHVQRRLARAEWREYLHHLAEDVTDLLLADEEILGVLTMLVEDAAFRSAVRLITSCDPIGCFHGRVYRMDAGAGHHDVWHGDDDDENRMVTLSVNLSPQPYDGGLLELRERATKRELARVANTGPGDGLFFRIDHALEHRVTDIEGATPKIAFAGWFQREPVIDLVRLVRP